MNEFVNNLNSFRAIDFYKGLFKHRQLKKYLVNNYKYIENIIR